MRKFLILLGLGIITSSVAQANQIDTCTTFADEPPGVRDQLLCAKEEQHAQELGLPALNEQTVLSLNDLYDLGWSLLTVQRFKNASENYVYRVYIVREE